MNGRCSNCRFFEESVEDWGRCRRYAPRPVVTSDDDGSPVMGTSNMVATWPYVEVDDSCGEWDNKR